MTRSRRPAARLTALAGLTSLPLLGALAVPVPVQAATPAGPEDVVINEVESNGDAVGDWVELANTNTGAALDVSGWTLVDDDAKHTPLALPAGTVVEPGGYLSVYVDVKGGFGLGAADSVTLRDSGGTVRDQTSWTAHAAHTWGRLPDKTGAFAETPAATRDAANDGGATTPSTDPPTTPPTTPTEPPAATDPWPGDPNPVTAIDLGPEFAKEDMSGIDVDAAGTAYVVNNGTGTLYVLAHDAKTDGFTIARSFRLTYPNGTGTPDAEGVTVGGDDAIYVASERDGAAKAVSRPSLLRYQLPPAGQSAPLAATTEYPLSGVIGPVGANAGPEAVQYLPDAWGGVYAVGVEATGKVLFLRLAGDGTVTVQQEVRTPLPAVMALDRDARTGALRVLCDEVCEGRSVEYAFDGTRFVGGERIVARPAGMANVANEGFASHLETVSCQVNGRAGTSERVRHLWADDAGTDGVSLRTQVVPTGACTPTATPTGPAPGPIGSVTGSLVSTGPLGSLGSLAPRS